jgi:hypothetical protein
MPTYVLGRDQTVSIDGSLSTGTREVEVDIAGRTMDLTGVDHYTSSTLVLGMDVTAKLLVYDPDIYSSLVSKMVSFPPQTVALDISGAGQGKFVIEKIAAKQPIDGVSSWEITFKIWNWN